MNFRNQKLQLQECLLEVQKLGETLQRPSLVKHIPDVIQQLAEERFVIVIAGEFDRGKTTFLKALSGGMDFLPVNSVANTGVITSVVYGDASSPNDTFRIDFKDGTSREEPLVNVAAYVAQDPSKGYNPQIDQIEKITLRVPLDFLRDNIEVIDTPGLGSVYTHHRDITRNQIEKSDACIFLMSQKSPAGASELRFLNEIYKHLGKVFIVLNQADEYLHNEDILQGEREKVLKVLKDNDILKFEVNRIYPMSAQWAFVGKAKDQANSVLKLLGRTDWTSYFRQAEVNSFEELYEKSRFSVFQDEFRSFIFDGEKAGRLLDSARQKIQNALADLSQDVSRRRQSLSNDTTIEELNRQVAAHEAKIEVIRQKIEVILANLEQDFKNLDIRLQTEISTRFNNFIANAEALVVKYLPTYESVSQQEQRDRAYVLFNREFETIQSEITVLLQEGIFKIADAAQQSAQNDLDEVLKDASSQFQLGDLNIAVPLIEIDTNAINLLDTKLDQELANLSRLEREEKAKYAELNNINAEKQDLTAELKKIEDTYSIRVRNLTTLSQSAPVFREWHESYERDKKVKVPKIKKSKTGWFSKGSILGIFPTTREEIVYEKKIKTVTEYIYQNNLSEIQQYQRQIDDISSKLAKLQQSLEDQLNLLSDIDRKSDRMMDIIKSVEQKKIQGKREIERIQQEKEKIDTIAKKKALEDLHVQLTEALQNQAKEYQIGFGENVRVFLKNYYGVFRLSSATIYDEVLNDQLASFRQLQEDKSRSEADQHTRQSELEAAQEQLLAIGEKIMQVHA